MATNKKLKWKVKGKIISTGVRDSGSTMCLHQTVMKGLCAECGLDLRSLHLLGDTDTVGSMASVSMVHCVPELIISQEEAIKLAKKDQARLLKDRKLVLLVDLDQTIIHTTSDLIPPNLMDVYHFQHDGPNHSHLWYHTKFRPHTREFLESISSMYELHICTFGTRMYAHTIARYLDPDGKFFSHRILSRDEFTNDRIKSGNIQSLFPCGDAMVCIIDDREDVWNSTSNLVQVKPYMFFQGTADINAPPGFCKTNDEQTAVIHRVRHVSRTKDGAIIHERTVGNDRKSNGSIITSSEETSDDKRAKETAEIGDAVCKIDNIDDKEESRTDICKSDDADGTECGTDSKSYNLGGDYVIGDEIDTGSQVSTLLNKESSENTGSHVETNDRVLVEPDNETLEVVNQIDMEIAVETEKIYSSNNVLSGKDLNFEKVGKDTVMNVCEVDNNSTNACDDVLREESIDSHTTDQVHIGSDKIESEKVIGSTGTKDGGYEVTKKLMDSKKCEKTNLEMDEKTNSDGLDSSMDEKSGKKLEENKSDVKKSDDIYEQIEWVDEDDYLFYLEDILKKIHRTFYDFLDKDESKTLPNLKNVIPYIKSKVLKGVNVLFSGVVPTNMTLEKSRAYLVAKALGAGIDMELVSRRAEPVKSKRTTHVIAARLGTVKVNHAKKDRKMHVVTPDWLWACNERWERVDERLYALTGNNQIPVPDTKVSRKGKGSLGNGAGTKKRKYENENSDENEIDTGVVDGDSSDTENLKRLKQSSPSSSFLQEMNVTRSPDASGHTSGVAVVVYDRVTGKRIKRVSSHSDISHLDLSHLDVSTTTRSIRDKDPEKPRADLVREESPADIGPRTEIPALTKATFAESINPLMMFTENDLTDMDKEVDDVLSEESNGSSSEDDDKINKKLRQAVLSGVEESSSDDSLDGGTYPRGWGISKRVKSRSCSSESLNEPEVSDASDNEAQEIDIGGSDSEPGTEFRDSVRSVDDEIAEAVQREFLSDL